MPKKILLALLLMGFTSLVVQTLLVREFLISFYGNELTIGVILANWIILEALGSGISGRFAPNSKKPHLVYALLQTGIALYLPLSVFLIRTVKNLLGLSVGEGIGIIPILFSSFFILAPLSLFDGIQFPFGCRILSDATKKPLESVGKTYVLEATGFILAGPIFTFLLVTKLNSFFIFGGLGLLNLISAVILLKDRAKDVLTKFSFTVINTVLIIAIFMFFGPVDKIHRFSINKQLSPQKVLDYRNSIYGNLAVTKQGAQYTFYSDGIPIITTPLPDINRIEELAHFSMLSCSQAKNVLLLSAGAGGLIYEILKYPIEKLTYAELDPTLIKLIKEYPTRLTRQELDDARLEIKHIDAIRFLRLTKEKYDAVILNLPMPSTLQINRFYTKEFFQNTKSVLNENGIFSFSLPGSLSYLNQPLRNLNGSILNTLKDVFYVNIVPGDFNLYISSKNKFELTAAEVIKRLQDKHIQTKSLNAFHLDERLHPRWKAWFDDSLSGYTYLRKNSDLLPSGTFYSVAYWNTAFSQNLQWLFNALDKLDFKFLLIGIIFLGLILFILTACIKKLRKISVGFAIGTTGFIGMGLNLILIYTYQSFYGFVFSHLALLVSAFMFGLTLGGMAMTKRLAKIKNCLILFSRIELLIAVFCLALWPLLLFLGKSGSLKYSVVFFLLSCASGYLVGLEFPLANKIYGQNQTQTKTAGIIYALDLIGGWLAALVISIALVPVIGVIQTCILLAVIKTVSFALITSAV